MNRHLKVSLVIFFFSFLFTNQTSAIDEFSQKVNGDIYGQVKVIDDVDGDGSKDLIFGATDGKIHIFSSSGKEIFRPPYWPKQVDSPVISSIEVADLDGKGSTNIIIPCMSGKVYCLNSKGKELWKATVSGELRNSTPLVTELDSSGNKSIIINSSSGEVNVYKSTGELTRTIKMDYAVNTSPAVCDLDGNGQKSIIVKDSNGKISIFNTNSDEDKEWNTSGDPDCYWGFGIEATDTDGDGKAEIYSTDPSCGTGIFSMWDKDGKLLSSFTLTNPSHGAPKVADIDGDGTDDFVIAQCDGKILVCDKNGTPKKGFPYVYEENGCSINGNPSIIDIDGDGSPEIVFALNTTKPDLEAGLIMAIDKSGNPLDKYPKFIGKTNAPLTFADLDGDGSLEIIAAGGIGLTGPQLHLFKTQAKRKFRMVTVRQETKIK